MEVAGSSETLVTTYSKLAVIQHVWETGCAITIFCRLHEEDLHDQIFTLFQSFNISTFGFRVKTTHFQFNYCTGVFSGDTADWWVEGF
jgi:hypothetical protein